MIAYTLQPGQACIFMHRPLCPKLWRGSSQFQTLRPHSPDTLCIMYVYIWLSCSKNLDQVFCASTLGIEKYGMYVLFVWIKCSLWKCDHSHITCVCMWLFITYIHIHSCVYTSLRFPSLCLAHTCTQSNMTTTQDSHSYYTSTYYPSGSAAASNLWLELSGGEGSGVVEDDSVMESVLSDHYRFYEVHVPLYVKSPLYSILHCTSHKMKGTTVPHRI